MSKDQRRIEFVYELEGTDEIDLFQFAPALLSLGRLIQEGNRTLNPGVPDIAVSIKPFQKSSFLTEIILFAVAAAPLLMSPSNLESAKQIKEVLQALGIVAGLKNSALDVVRKLGGKIEKVEELKPGEIQYTTGHQTIIVNGPVNKLIQNPVVRKEYGEAYARPFDQPEVTAIKSFVREQESGERSITRQDAPKLRRFAQEEVPPERPMKALEDIESVAYLNPNRGSFNGEGGRWTFRKGDASITATMKDRAFLQKQAAGIYRLHGSDLLTVRLIEKPRISGTEVTSTYEIPEVIDYQPGPIERWLALPPPSEPDH